ncbi:hypothetical protein KCU64_g82, partial [Aureobasidium melanogenum]
MEITETTHPPAGATALLPATNEEIRALSWYFLPIVLLSSAILMVVALLNNNIQRRYPIFCRASIESGDLVIICSNSSSSSSRRRFKLKSQLALNVIDKLRLSFGTKESQLAKSFTMRYAIICTPRQRRMRLKRPCAVTLFTNNALFSGLLSAHL